MATLRDLKRRIVGITNTMQITKAMKMVAAARLRRAQDNMINARPYSRKLSQVLNHLLRSVDVESTLFEEREIVKVAIMVITSDRGLCGGFNMNAIRTVEDLVKDQYKEEYDNGNVSLYCVGKKGVDYFSRRNYNVVGSYSGIFSNLTFDFAVKLLSDLKQKFLSKEIDRVVIVYNEFKSVAQQNMRVQQLLPIVASDEEEESAELAEIDYLYEPDKATIIDTLLPKYLNSQVWKVLLESYAAELGARMTAMDMATENAKELISSLKLSYNKARQSAITTEINEIVSGANALKKA